MESLLIQNGMKISVFRGNTLPPTDRRGFRCSGVQRREPPPRPPSPPLLPNPPNPPSLRAPPPAHPKTNPQTATFSTTSRPPLAALSALSSARIRAVPLTFPCSFPLLLAVPHLHPAMPPKQPKANLQTEPIPTLPSPPCALPALPAATLSALSPAPLPPHPTFPSEHTETRSR